MAELNGHYWGSLRSSFSAAYSFVEVWGVLLSYLHCINNQIALPWPAILPDSGWFSSVLAISSVSNASRRRRIFLRGRALSSRARLFIGQGGRSSCIRYKLFLLSLNGLSSAAILDSVASAGVLLGHWAITCALAGDSSSAYPAKELV